MNQAQFKCAYIAQFLASYMASTYERDCQAGHPGKPYDHQPVEDAAFLAECAWEQICKMSTDRVGRFFDFGLPGLTPSEGPAAVEKAQPVTAAA